MFYLVLRDDGCLPLSPTLLTALELRPGDTLQGHLDHDGLVLRPAPRIAPATGSPFLP